MPHPPVYLTPISRNSFAKFRVLSVNEYATALETVSKVNKQEGRQNAARAFTMAYSRSKASPVPYPFCLSTKINNQVGFCWLTLRKMPRLRAMHVLNLHILPIYRGHGIGSSTMQELVILCRTKRFSAITLSVSSSNPRIGRFYERLGFERWCNGYIKHV